MQPTPQRESIVIDLTEAWSDLVVHLVHPDFWVTIMSNLAY